MRDTCQTSHRLVPKASVQVEQDDGKISRQKNPLRTQVMEKNDTINGTVKPLDSSRSVFEGPLHAI